MPAPLWFFHEDSYNVACNTAEPLANASFAVLPAAVRDRVCTIDLFLAEPWLMNLMLRTDSCIDAFYYAAGNREPLIPRMGVMSGKLLVRKVASIYHAVNAVDDGTAVLWLDFDVYLRASLSEPSTWRQFADFVRAHDVTYLPFKPKQYSANDTVKLTESWAVESGVLAVRAAPRLRELLAQLLRYYDGNAVDWVHKCTCSAEASGSRGSSSESSLHLCQESWLSGSLYLDDMWAWTLYLQADLRGVRSALVGGGARSSSTTLSHGWFGLAISERHPVGTGCKSWLGSTSVCPGASVPGVSVSSFNLRQLLLHNMANLAAGKTGPYTAMLASSQLRNTSLWSRLPEHLIMPQGAPGTYCKDPTLPGCAVISRYDTRPMFRPKMLLHTAIANCTRWRRQQAS